MNTNQINTALAAALEPTRQAVIERVRESILARVARTYATLEANGWDLRPAFPINYNSRDCQMQKEAQAFAREYTQQAAGWKTTMRPNEPLPRVKIGQGQIETKAQKTAEKYAADLLAEYAHKLTAKIEKFREAREVVSCDYTGGSDPWGFSWVKVTLANGETFTLQTKCIVNCSVLGKLFNQFPTRLV